MLLSTQSPTYLEFIRLASLLEELRLGADNVFVYIVHFSLAVAENEVRESPSMKKPNIISTVQRQSV